jgi:hypothetical protein
MDPREQFLTEEFFRYSAECRRLARLARKPASAAKGRTPTVRLWVEKFEEIFAAYLNPPAHRPQYLTSRPVHR